jgi:mannose-6-phosphate isomerase-like protein (cupin superfamily)
MNFILLFAALFFSADAAKVWTNQELSAQLAGAKPDAHKITQASLGHYPGYSMSLTKREASGIGELHEEQTDLMFIESGECTLVLGGKLVNPKNQSSVEVRGSGIEGGVKHHVAAGDVIRIPAKTPHQMLLEPGKSVVYAVVKVASK